MATFIATMGWKRSRKKESKYCCSVSFQPNRNRKFQKNSKKIQKN